MASSALLFIKIFQQFHLSTPYNFAYFVHKYKYIYQRLCEYTQLRLKNNIGEAPKSTKRMSVSFNKKKKKPQCYTKTINNVILTYLKLNRI